MRRILEITSIAVLLLLLLLQLQGPWVVFKAQQQHVRKAMKQEIKAGVAEDQLILLRIAKVWEEQPNHRFEREHSKEFRFDGEMYDIIREKDLGDTTLYYVIHDPKESKLFDRLDEMVDYTLDQPDEQKQRNLLYQWVSSKYTSADTSSHWRLPALLRKKAIYIKAYQSYIEDLEFPPPQALPTFPFEILS